MTLRNQADIRTSSKEKSNQDTFVWNRRIIGINCKWTQNLFRGNRKSTQLKHYKTAHNL